MSLLYHGLASQPHALLGSAVFEQVEASVFFHTLAQYFPVQRVEIVEDGRFIGKARALPFSYT
ncbi:hypothetical protein [Hymenobacter sp. YC55]|uniref:hypothetical protein n=1 Tax=Hymenobacter sp. YC55 TaxID=3034019 RepID=UPI0023F6352D|nr:hypothetical protein [Hymenobacter sp. YC55]MDF7811488.1 hypothetical protein [Hymenobacter sp. YC55]